MLTGRVSSSLATVFAAHGKPVLFYLVNRLHIRGEHLQPVQLSVCCAEDAASLSGLYHLDDSATTKFPPPSTYSR